MDGIFSVAVHPDDVTPTVATWAVATVTHNKDFNSIYIIVKDDEKLRQIKRRILDMFRWTKHEDIVHHRVSNRITIGEHSTIQIVVGIDNYPPGQTFTKVFLVDFNDKERERAMQLLAPVVITKNVHNGIVAVNSWD